MLAVGKHVAGKRFVQSEMIRLALLLAQPVRAVAQKQRSDVVLGQRLREPVIGACEKRCLLFEREGR